MAAKIVEVGLFSEGGSIDSVKSFVTCFGLGLLPKAPGTFGSLFGLALVFALSLISWPYYFGFSILYCALSLWLVSVYLKQSHSKDPKEVVADEVMGILISFFLVPISGFTLVLGFLLFRFFDILKPPPISFFDRKVPGAVGVMGDDIVAGLIVNMIFHFIVLDPQIMNTIKTSVGPYLGF